MSWAEARTIQETIEEKTSIKVQTVTFQFTSGLQDIDTQIETINKIDIERSTIVPISLINLSDLNVGSLSFEFKSDTEISCRRTQLDGMNRKSFRITVQIITYGANVSKE